MASDAAVSQMIFFIAAILVSSAMAAVFIGIGWEMSNNINDQGDVISENMATQINIINDPVMVPYSDNNLTIYVENTGSNILTPSSLTILLDGTYINVTYSHVVDTASSNWGPSVVLQIDIVEPLTSGDHYIRISTRNGDSDTMEFRI